MYDKLQNKNLAVTKFFEAALATKPIRLAHAYMLTGNDFSLQYYLAIETARILNCTGDKSTSCQCTNCSWISKNSHPAVITISPSDYNYDGNGNKDKPGTVIKVEQARYLRNILGKTSDYHRVIIFTDAVKSVEESKFLKGTYNVCPPYSEEDEKSDWAPSAVTYKIFQEETANTLLKTIEEPSAGVTFFFLTRDAEDMLDTIVSRCQTVPVTSAPKYKAIPDDVKNILEHIPPQNESSALRIAEALVKLCDNYDFEQILEYMALHQAAIIKANADKKLIVSLLIQQLELIEQAKKEYRSHVNIQAIADKLLLRLAESGKIGLSLF